MFRLKFDTSDPASCTCTIRRNRKLPSICNNNHGPILYYVPGTKSSIRIYSTRTGGNKFHYLLDSFVALKTRLERVCIRQRELIRNISFIHVSQMILKLRTRFVKGGWLGEGEISRNGDFSRKFALVRPKPSRFTSDSY